MRSLFKSEKFKNIFKINYPGVDALNDDDDEHRGYIRQVGYNWLGSSAGKRKQIWLNNLGKEM